jgi:ribosomal protein S18 acetylase RimI-like enzyme
MQDLLANVLWHALSGTQARYSVGTAVARRYAPGFSPIAAFANAEEPDFAALAPFCERGEHLYCDRWAGTPPAGWRVQAEAAMLKMLWSGAVPPRDEAVDALPLGHEHVAQAMELVALTKPGPFGPRTIELGEYFGCFEGDRLIAMAGERLQAGFLREISGVCTHPDSQGRGHARRLMLKLVRRQMLRGETPFLHVMSDNPARRLYERMGFRDVLQTVVRVVSPA